MPTSVSEALASSSGSASIPGASSPVAYFRASPTNLVKVAPRRSKLNQRHPQKGTSSFGATSLNQDQAAADFPAPPQSVTISRGSAPLSPGVLAQLVKTPQVPLPAN